MRRAGAAALLAALVLVVSAGCVGGVDPSTLPGTYVSADRDGSLTLHPDGTFAAEAVPVEVLGDVSDAERVDLAGTWEYLDLRESTFVYLSVDEVVGGTSNTWGVQLYVGSGGSVYFRPDPDRGGTIDYERQG